MAAPTGPILVIDDDPDLCALMRRTLEHEGWKVVTANDGMQAIRAFELNRPAMLFVDLMMPQLDGEELLRVLGSPRPPVVLITASVRRQEVADSFGIDHALEKPFDIADVIALARRYVGEPPSADAQSVRDEDEA
ncbi:MAG TPA: response regulator [Sandaracinaceae bacterium LLY-WYZ-13_1]|nr:response regulator [Sandaracinaceae bacterium LLY-WYZ-13_1]